MSNPSITTEIDAVYPTMETTGYGLVAFRFGGIAVKEHAEEIDPSVPLEIVVQAAREIKSDVYEIEAAKRDYPDEFALGATCAAYQIRKAART